MTTQRNTAERVTKIIVQHLNVAPDRVDTSAEKSKQPTLRRGQSQWATTPNATTLRPRS